MSLCKFYALFLLVQRYKKNYRPFIDRLRFIKFVPMHLNRIYSSFAADKINSFSANVLGRLARKTKILVKKNLKED